MKDTDTQQLIDRLSQEASASTAKNPLPPPAWWAVRLIALLAAYGLGVQFFLQVRPDIAVQFGRPAFVAEIALLVVLSLSSAVAAIFAMYPDMHQKPWLLRIPYAVFAALAGFIAFQLFAMPYDPRMVIPSSGMHGMECALCIASVAIVPSALVFGILRKGASVTPLRAASFAVLAAAGLGCLTLRLAEASDSLVHLAAWHYTPTLAFAALGALAGKFLLKW